MGELFYDILDDKRQAALTTPVIFAIVFI